MIAINHLRSIFICWPGMTRCVTTLSSQLKLTMGNTQSQYSGNPTSPPARYTKGGPSPISMCYPRSISMGRHIHVHTGTYTLQAERQADSGCGTEGHRCNTVQIQGLESTKSRIAVSRGSTIPPPSCPCVPLHVPTPHPTYPSSPTLPFQGQPQIYHRAEESGLEIFNGLGHYLGNRLCRLGAAGHSRPAGTGGAGALVSQLLRGGVRAAASRPQCPGEHSCIPCGMGLA